ncbi:hypothetical protein BJX76DRAFT_335953 [Aspergillus varians]
MKTATILSILLATGSSLAMPAKRAGQAATISDLFASQTSQNGYVTFAFNDPNKNDNTGANVVWDRPGKPRNDSRTADAAYYVRFPGGVTDISLFNLLIERVDGSEQFSIAISDNGNGGAPGTKWSCDGESGVDESKHCHYNGTISLTPASS